MNKFNYKPKNVLPILGKTFTDWDLMRHYYKSVTDVQIEQDISLYERKVKSFARKYSNSDFTKNPKILLSALTDYEVLSGVPEASRVIRYFYFRTTVDVNDREAGRKLSQYSEHFRKLNNQLIFFGLTIGKVAKTTQKKYLKDSTLKKYWYFLELIFQSGSHQLSEPEEKVMSLRANTSEEMWGDAVDKIISNRAVTFKNETYPIPAALEYIEQLSWVQKGVLWNKILDELVQISEVAEHELTAIVLHNKVNDELRGYKKPYSATVQSYENDEKSVEALIEAISNKGFALSKKFYKLKAKFHGQKTIPYVNKYDPIGKLPVPNFEVAIEICRDTFYGLDNKFGDIFDRMLTSGQIDVFPKAGKRGGAFMNNAVGTPTLVMLNHGDDFNSVATLAHEMGHAVHAELSKCQSPIYEDFSITTAETASTLFEQLVMDKIIDSLPSKQQGVFLHNKITRDIATVQRQIAFFNLELEMHQHIREHGLVTKMEMARMMQKHLQSYLGSSVNVTEQDGYSFVTLRHIRYGFYVYTYTYGHLVSNLMIQNYYADKSYLKQINQFLHAGGSNSVENIFAEIGINTKKVDTFLASLEMQEAEISKFAKLI